MASVLPQPLTHLKVGMLDQASGVGAMHKSSEQNHASPPSVAAALHALIDSVRDWLGGMLELAVLEGKKAGLGLALILGFAVGAITLLIAGWLTLVGCLVVVLVAGDFLGLGWSLVIAALLNFAGAGGLVLLAIKHSQDLSFLATRRQLGFKPASNPNPGHDQSHQ